MSIMPRERQKRFQKLKMNFKYKLTNCNNVLNKSKIQARKKLIRLFKLNQKNLRFKVIYSKSNCYRRHIISKSFKKKSDSYQLCLVTGSH